LAAYAYDNSASTNGDPSVRVVVSWNRSGVHPGARLGIYDGTCGGTSSACLIQDRALPDGNSGVQTFYLGRNELVPMIPVKTDPNLALNMIVAIHYPIPKYDSNGQITGYKNNHGIDKQQIINLRNLDYSNASSQLLGEITSIRMDMQYYYIKGWTCFQGSNAMSKVELQDLNGNAIVSKYAYDYPYMVPHSTPIDWMDEFNSYKNLESKPYVQPFMAKDIKAIYANPAAAHPAGLEALPNNVFNCKTLTASHGFEILVPLDEIKRSGLEDKSFQVISHYQRGNIDRLTNLKDANGRFSYSFPEVNFQTNIQNSFSVNRSIANTLQVTGTLCSQSPSPIEIEVTAGTADYEAAIFGDNRPETVNSGERPDLAESNVNSGYVYDPSFSKKYTTQQIKVHVSLGAGNDVTYADIDSFLAAVENNDFQISITKREIKTYQVEGGMDADTVDKINHFRDTFDAFEPATMNTYADINVYLDFDANHRWRNELHKFFSNYSKDQISRLQQVSDRIAVSVNNKIKTLHLQQVKTQEPLDYHYFAPISLDQLGVASFQDRQIDAIDKSGAIIKRSFDKDDRFSYSNSDYWDYYDVGMGFSTDLVGYIIKADTPVGKYLKSTYSVDSILREAKKYEVPQSSYMVNLVNGRMINSGQGSCPAGQFSHSISNLTINNLDSFTPNVSEYNNGFWVEGHDPESGYKPLPAASVYMQRLPLEVRLFQDGRLILHEESDTQNNWTKITYPFQKENY